MAGTAQHKSSIVARFWWVGLILVAVVAGIWFLAGSPKAAVRAQALPGYISSVSTVAQEYARFQGKVLQNPDVEQEFQQANEHIANRDYSGAVALLETASQQAAVPVIFNNLGVLYAQLNDRARAINAFREALARDIDYQPVRFNLNRLKGFTSRDADPVTTEIEPNNNSMTANLMAINKPVEGEIAEGTNDVDFFRVTTPPPPRDLIAIDVQNHSKTLAPVLKIYNAEMQITSWGKDTRQPGSSLTQYFSPPPNATFFIEITGYGGTAGAYTLSVRQLKAFDAFEPNDDIFTARTIKVGESIDANIMDPADTDYFSFVSPRTGLVTVSIHNKSTTLLPALSTFGPDMRSTGFGPDIRTPGASLKHAMEVQEGQTYYIQVWSQANTAGDYSLIIQ